MIDSFVGADTGNASAWFALLGALSGVLITSMAALSTAVLNNRWRKQDAERQFRQRHAEQLRQERRETYAHYLSTWNRLTQRFRDVAEQVNMLDPHPSSAEEARERISADLVDQVRAAEVEWHEAGNKLRLVAGSEVNQAFVAHLRETITRLGASWRGEYEGGRATHGALLKTMREEIIDPLES